MIRLQAALVCLVAAIDRKRERKRRRRRQEQLQRRRLRRLHLLRS